MDKTLKVSIMLAAIDKMTTVINKATDNGIKSLSRMKKKADELSSSAFEFGRSAGTFGLAMAAPLALAVNAAGEYEQMNVALKTSFQGNEKAAQQAFKVVNDFAAKTPYELNEVMTGFIKLKNMGLDPSIEALTAYGNTASGMGKSLNDMVEAVADAATGEFERLKEFGIRSKSEGDKVTFTFQGVNTTVKKNAAEIERYIKNIGLTKFAGGIEAQSKTFNGQLSTMKDNVKMFGASIGAILIPVLNDLFKKIQPVMDQITKWMKEHPKLTKMIVIGAAAIAALALVCSGLAFVFGGLIKIVGTATSIFRYFMMAIGFTTKSIGFLISLTKAQTWAQLANNNAVLTGRIRLMYMKDAIIKAFTSLRTMSIATVFQTVVTKAMTIATSIGTGVMRGLTMAFKMMGGAIQWLGRVMLANPILLVITLIALAVYALYKNWDKVVQWFKDLWKSVTAIFSAFWNWVKSTFSGPIKLLKAGWNAIISFFSGLWNKIKGIFVGMWNWVMGLGKRFLQAGANIVNSIWEGIKNTWSKLVNWFKKGIQKLRDMLPFSPAKEGPLRDIHRLKLVETIAANIKPGPMVRAMQSATGAVRAAMPTGTGLGAGMAGGGGGGVIINFSPNITLGGGASPGMKQDILTMLREYEPQLLRIVEDAMARRDRKKF